MVGGVVAVVDMAVVDMVVIEVVDMVIEVVDMVIEDIVAIEVVDMGDVTVGVAGGTLETIPLVPLRGGVMLPLGTGQTTPPHKERTMTASKLSLGNDNKELIFNSDSKL